MRLFPWTKGNIPVSWSSEKNQWNPLNCSITEHPQSCGWHVNNRNWWTVSILLLLLLLNKKVVHVNQRKLLSLAKQRPMMWLQQGLVIFFPNMDNNYLSPLASADSAEHFSAYYLLTNYWEFKICRSIKDQPPYKESLTCFRQFLNLVVYYYYYY